MNEYRVRRKLMGSAFELLVVEKSEKRAGELLEMGLGEIQRLENLLSEFKTDSVTSKINQNAGKKEVVVDQEIFALLERCRRISGLTGGAFDITVGPLKKLYDFRKEKITFPDKSTVRQALTKTGYHHMILSEERSSIYLEQKGMQISFAAIGKGLAADNVKKIWKAQGVESGFIDASGDLTAFGSRADGSPWKVGIADPDHPDEILFYLPVNAVSIATSGDHEQHFIMNGKRYSHNIHPKTGLPLQGHKSVSVISPSAELSDALATAVSVMGIKNGINFVDQLPETHCIMINGENQCFFSKNLEFSHEKHR